MIGLTSRRVAADSGALAVPQRPTSATVPWINLASFLALFACVLLLSGSGLSATHRVLWCLASMAAPQLLLLALTDRSLLGRAAVRPLSVERAVPKLLGLAVTAAVLALLYWLLPEYRRELYQPFRDALPTLLPWALLLTPPYLLFVDRRMEQPEDAYWQIGSLLLGRRVALDRQLLVQHALGWIVKGYFFPLMLAYLSGELSGLANLRLHFAGFRDFYESAYRLAYFTDVAFATIGYLATLRLFDTQIRSTEPTAFGWIVCLLCYEPFWNGVRNAYFDYEGPGATVWGAWLADRPIAYALWGSAILCLVWIYAWTTVSFGLRFSNLTHRGIITDGPFRLTKHPHYVSKNLSWWLISVPFIASAGWDTAIRHCLLLLGVNAIYFARAWTEERHLARDPAYLAYALWMERHGCLRFLARLVPALSFTRLHPELFAKNVR
jgi:hypothetical protein